MDEILSEIIIAGPWKGGLVFSFVFLLLFTETNNLSLSTLSEVVGSSLSAVLILSKLSARETEIVGVDESLVEGSIASLGL